MLRSLLSAFAGKTKHQKYWNKLFQLSLLGMNIGSGSNVEESGEFFILKSLLQKNYNKKFVLFDVGANVGNYAKSALSINQSVDMYCFEPSRTTFESLKDNVSNVEHRSLHLYNFGFSDTNGIVTLYTDRENSGLGSVYKRRLDHFNITMEREEQILLQTLDSFCAENGISQIDLLKLDVEGHELKVLKGACNLIKNDKIKYIQFEFGGCNIDSRTFFQDFYYLLSPNFHIYRILKDGLYPIQNYSELDELFVTTNYFAINRNYSSEFP